MGCVKSDVLLLPPAFVRAVLASSNMKWADASDGWLGTEGYKRLPLNRLTLMPQTPIPPTPPTPPAMPATPAPPAPLLLRLLFKQGKRPIATAPDRSDCRWCCVCCGCCRWGCGCCECGAPLAVGWGGAREYMLSLPDDLPEPELPESEPGPAGGWRCGRLASRLLRMALPLPVPRLLRAPAPPKRFQYNLL